MADFTVTAATAGIEPNTGTPETGRTPEQLRTLAAQFESLLLGQMMREMRQSMFDDGDGDENAFGGGPLADALFSELSVALSRAGGFGLGSSLMGPLMNEAGSNVGLVPTEIAASPVLDAATPALPAESLMPAALMPAAVTSAAMPGRLSSAYGWRRDPIDGSMKFHKGLDLALPVGRDVPAARPGQIEFAGELEGYGLTVVVKHDERMSTRYAHLSAILVRQGESVTAGQTIALSGASGRTTGPHLHFEVLEGGKPVDPRKPW